MHMRALFLTGLLAGLLTACGPPLGEYEVAELSIVDELPSAIRHTRPPEPYLRIEVTSDFDIVAGANGNIYSFKVGCGYFGDEERMIFGPVTAGDPSVDSYDAEPAMPRDANGKAHYLLFIPVIAEARLAFSNSDEILPAHDLRTEDGDLCLAIKQRGYFITDSTSETIRIPAADIASVLDL